MSMDLALDERPLSVAVVIASLGRPELIEQMRGLIAAQTRAPDMLLYSVVSEGDVRALSRKATPAKLSRVTRGSVRSSTIRSIS